MSSNEAKIRLFKFLSIPLVTLFLIFSCQKKVSVSEPEKYEVGIAQYYITTDPTGAHIHVDGRPTGQFTPDTIKWLVEGVHNFKLELHPYLNYIFQDTVQNLIVNSTKYSYYNDPQNFGSINFSSSPDSCTIFLDENKLEYKTPYELTNLLPREYKIKYTFPEHRADSIVHFVNAGKRTFARMELKDTSVWVTYNIENSDINDNTIKDILVDKANTIWIGTWHNGVIKINSNNYDFINSSNSNLPNDIIHCFAMGNNNTIWVGSYNGLAKIERNNVTAFTTNNSGIPSNYIADINIDKENNLWVGTTNGLAKFDGTQWTIFNIHNSSIPGNFVTKIMFDKQDSLWIGTMANNIAKYHNRYNWKVYQSDNLPKGDSVADLIIGNDNNIWVALIPQYSKPGVVDKVGGIFKLENEQLVLLDIGIPNIRINKFYLDDENILWAGSKNGIFSIYSGGYFKVFNSTNSGLPINDVLSIEKDKNGNIWFGSNNAGLIKYKVTNAK